MKVVAKKVKIYRSRIEEEASRAYRSDDPGAVSWCDSDLWKEYDPDSDTGRQVYLSYTDKELLELLRAAARRLERSPTKKDIYCVYRSYLCKRFGNWPKALQRAGLDK